MKYVGSMEPHYGLRKLSIGVASVLLGMSIYGAVGHADPVNSSENVNVDENVSEGSVNDSNQVVLQSEKAVSAASSDENTVGEGTKKQEVQTTGNSSVNDNAVQNVVDDRQQLQNSNNMPQNDVSYDNQKAEQQIVSDQAENVDLDFSGEVTNPSSINNGQPVTWGTVLYFGLDGSFDLTETQLKSTDNIRIGTVSCSQSIVWAYPLTFRTKVNDVSFSLPDGQVVGNFFVSGDSLFAKMNGSYTGTGSQHFSFQDAYCEVGYMPSTSGFRGHGTVPTVLTLQAGSHSYKINIAAPVVDPIVSQSSNRDPMVRKVNGWSYGDSTPYDDLQILWNVASRLTDDQRNAWIRSNGMTIGNGSIPDADEPFEYIFKLSADDTLSPYSVHIEKRADTMDSKGVLHDDNWNHYANSYGGDDDYYISNAGDGLTLSQMRKLNSNNKSGALVYYSRQNDGSLLIYAKFPASDLKIKNYNELRNELNNSSVINLDPDPQKAIDNTINYYKNQNPLAGFPLQDNLVIWYSRMDPSKDTHIEITYYDPATDKAINLKPIKGTWLSNTTKVNGQSTIKLHIINSTNGADLSQVKSFTDWPNKGKHAELDLPNITGYQVVTNDPASVLSRLHLTGTAITANTQADYPKENTIADYYIVMEPKTETATVNIVDDDENDKVLDSGQVSGKFSAGIVSDDVINAKLQKLLDSGLYTLESNDLEKGLTYKDGSQTVNIKLKHKIDSVSRHYRIIENLPDGSQKVIIDLNATLYKDADAKYYNRQGALLDGSGKILKANNIKLTVGQWAFDNDNTAGVALIDKIAGYSYGMPDHLTDYMVGGVTGDIVAGNLVNRPNIKELAYLDLFVGGSSNGGPFLTLDPTCTDKPLPSRDFHIVYTKNQYPVTINYYDLSGKQISSSTTAHIYLDQVDANALAPKGYVLLTGQDSKLTVSWDHNELDLLVAPAITRTSQNKAITRTINVENAQGQVIKTVVQTVNFTRDQLTDQISHQVTSTAWQAMGSNEFASYTPSVIDGYTVDSIASKAVNGDDSNSVITVRYQAVNTKKMPKYVDINGIGYDKVLDGYEVVKGQDLNKNGILIIKKPAPVIANKIEYVTRTITVYMPNGRTRTIKQRVRKGSKFLAAHLPKLRGYRVEITGNVNQAAADGNMTASVKFVKI